MLFIVAKRKPSKDQIEPGLAGGGGGGGCCWIVEWCGVADRAKRRALAPNLRSNAVVVAADAASSSLSCPHDTTGHGRSASLLLRRSRKQQQQQQPSNRNSSTYVKGSPNSRHQRSGGYSSSFSRSGAALPAVVVGSSSCDATCPASAAILFQPSALPKRLQNVLDDKKRLTFTQRPADSNRRRHIIAGRTAMSDNFIYGDITRELYEIWCRVVPNGSAVVAETQRLQSLFHQASVYPSQSQILEMIHCARERELQLQQQQQQEESVVMPAASTSTALGCGSKDPPQTDGNLQQRNFLTFGEFCLFAHELRKSYEREIPRPTQLSKVVDIKGNDKKMSDRKISKSAAKYQVFLGGSCNPTTWRQDIAIPLLKTWGLTYFNPQVPQWGPELIEKEHQAKQTADVLFFVIDKQTRSVATIVEAAYYTAAQKTFILVIHALDGPGQLIQGEPITEREYEDLATGQLVLQDMVERLGIPVFSNIRLALDCTAKILKERITVQELGLSDGISPLKNPHYPIGDKLIKLRDAFNALDTSNSGEISMADVCMAFRILTNRDLSVDDLKNIVASSNEQTSVSFDQFCCILTEFRNLPADNQRRFWDVMASKAATLLYSVVSPVSRILCRPSPKGVARCDSSSPEVTMGGARDIYLGGSCGSTTWREQTAIPLLKKSGLTYFNPQTCGWSRRFIPIEAAAMDASRVLLFVVSRETRSLSSMALAAHYIGLGCNVVLCIQRLPDNAEINGDRLSAFAIKDYNRGRNYLSDLANREGIPVFDEIKEAVECAIQRCHQQLVLLQNQQTQIQQQQR